MRYLHRRPSQLLRNLRRPLSCPISSDMALPEWPVHSLCGSWFLAVWGLLLLVSSKHPLRRQWDSCNVPFISYDVRDLSGIFKSITGCSFRFALDEVFERKLGQEGALVSAPRRSKSSLVVDLHPSAAFERLHKVMENPGPFNEVSKDPEYIFTRRMRQSTSYNVRRTTRLEVRSSVRTYPVG